MAENEEIVSEKTNIMIVIEETNMMIVMTIIIFVFLRKKQREELPTISLLLYRRPCVRYM